MPVRELLSELRGVLVISREEGANLGVVSRLYFDPETAKIACLSLGQRRGHKRYLEIKDILSFGRDVVLVSSEEDVKTTAAGTGLRGRSLKELQGTWVTTRGGEHLGTLVDLDAGGDDWAISELRLADGKRLPVLADEITIGPDEIIVPTEYAAKVVPDSDEKPGFLGRLFGRESVEEARRTISRAVKRAPQRSGAKEEGPTGKGGTS